MLQEKYEEELRYIHDYWDRIIFDKKSGFYGWRNLVMRIGRINLPNPVVSPNHRYFATTQFYWDSYFMQMGLYDDGRLETAARLLDNQMYLFNKYGIILARNSLTALGRTQPPFLTSMIREREKHEKNLTRHWLDDAYQLAEREYHQVWLTKPRYDTETGLSCYQTKLFPNYFQKFESGWDLSSRFMNGKVIPIDLNCLLFAYESDLQRHAELRKETGRAAYWQKRKDIRRRQINKYMWDETVGFYFDYNSGNQEKSRLATLAGFFPLWCGAASKMQAAACVKQLEIFEYAGGLASTEQLDWQNRQWDFPNGWANLQYIVIEGLIRYGYVEEAKRIGLKWLELNSDIFKRDGVFWEKYDVVECDIGKPGRYPTADGFGWTNAVFSRLVKRIDQLR